MLIAIAIVIVLGLSGLRVAQEYQRGVVFRLGRYVGLRGPGLYWIIPLNIERAVTIDIHTRTVSAELSAAAAQMMANPAALELRRMQMISEVGAENNSTTVLMIPSDFVSLSHTLDKYLQQRSADSAATRDSHG
jgi:regulator of protease activity HflC (stomatin/prohibitin superfamily)